MRPEKEENKMRGVMLLIIAVLCFGMSSSASGEVAVIVNSGNSESDVSLGELKSIYFGENKKWGNGSKIVLVDQKSNKELCEKFYKTTTGKSPSALKEIWIKKMLTGEMSPPKAFDSDQAVIKFVASNEGAIGFIDSQSATGSVKVLAIEGKLPKSNGYSLK